MPMAPCLQVWQKLKTTIIHSNSCQRFLPLLFQSMHQQKPEERQQSPLSPQVPGAEAALSLSPLPTVLSLLLSAHGQPAWVSRERNVCACSCIYTILCSLPLD